MDEFDYREEITLVVEKMNLTNLTDIILSDIVIGLTTTKLFKKLFITCQLPS
jgi:hypothetical protein